MTYIAVFKSLSFVNKVKRYMFRKGEYVDMVHSPSCLSKGGCSFALRFSEEKSEAVFEAVKATGISMSGIYREVIKGELKSYEAIEDIRGNDNGLS